MSIRLYIGNLPKEIDRKELQAVFAEAGEGVSTKVITDRKTGKCRGFGFVTVKTDEEADQLIEKYNGYLFKENALKIEKALPRAKGKGEEEQRPATAAPAAPTPKPSGGGSSGSSERSSGNRRGGGGGGNNNNNKSRRSASTTSTDSEAIQPDPRWAQALEELKQRLAAQTTN